MKNLFVQGTQSDNEIRWYRFDPETLHTMHAAAMRFDEAVNRAAEAERPDHRVHDSIVFEGKDAGRRASRFHRRLAIELSIADFEHSKAEGRTARIARAQQLRQLISNQK